MMGAKSFPCVGGGKKDHQSAVPLFCARSETCWVYYHRMKKGLFFFFEVLNELILGSKAIAPENAGKFFLPC